MAWEKAFKMTRGLLKQLKPRSAKLLTEANSGHLILQLIETNDKQQPFTIAHGMVHPASRSRNPYWVRPRERSLHLLNDMDKKKWGSGDRIQLARVMVYEYVCDVLETMSMDDDIIEVEDFEGADGCDMTVRYGWIPDGDAEDDDDEQSEDTVLFVQDHPKFLPFMEEQTHLRELYRAMVSGTLSKEHVLLYPPA
jgi:hypothetical protein